MADVATLLEGGHRRLRAGQSPGLDAALLLGHVLGRSRTWLHAWPEHPVGPSEQARYEALLAARERGEPVAHLVGEREFWSLPLRVTRDTLIPRPETETLVEAALAVAERPPEAFADLGTGTGAVALALAREWPDARIFATELSGAAAMVARENADRLGMAARVEVLEGDWLEALPAGYLPLIVANPPYIGTDEPEPGQGDAAFEPRAALLAGEDGLAALRTIIAAAPAHLLPKGWLLLEHGWRQGPAVRSLLAAAGFRAIETWRDLAGHERVSGGRRDASSAEPR
ncbi:peptide chain release factor N(5)-glutamine methyltransferase [Arhodomonas sp. SL1]|uniref:peptide chain release factor N(5)-glutamine methyltransferase n=1 Tax=Arhodomonas sp. SL1 TaxID=3425691 RepID=UPI003F882517